MCRNTVNKINRVFFLPCDEASGPDLQAMYLRNSHMGELPKNVFFYCVILKLVKKQGKAVDTYRMQLSIVDSNIFRYKPFQPLQGSYFRDSRDEKGIKGIEYNIRSLQMVFFIHFGVCFLIVPRTQRFHF